MKLAEYLTNYIEHERASRDCGYIGARELESLIQQGIEAFASTEDKVVEVIEGDGFGYSIVEHYS